MPNTQQFHAERAAPLRELEARFKSAREFILQHRPDEQVGGFGSIEGIETMHHDDLEILKITRGLEVKGLERRADDVQAEVEEAERVRAETQRQQNMTPLEVRIERLERANAYLAHRVTKLEGGQTGRLPALPHVARSDVPQFLGMPSGLGRPAVVGTPGGSSGVRKLAAGASAPASDTPAQSGFTRWPHPLDVIGSSGKR
jgi:hypothetical protein